MRRAAWLGFQRCRLSAYQRRATASKVLRKAAYRAALACCLAAAGSAPFAKSARAISVAWRASSRETAGYLPMVSSFSFPSIRYFSRHDFPPAGVTAKYRPPPSASL
nr:MAG TPA: hypothetical protein [Caudoviricetes sp.]